jgi:hypothetical protein
MYVDSNGDFWSVSTRVEPFPLGEEKLFFGGLSGATTFFYTSPDCSGPPNFVNLPAYAHVVFDELRPDQSHILRVRQTNAKLQNILVQSTLQSNSFPMRCDSVDPQLWTVLIAADTTVVTPPNIAVSLPLHPVLTP